MAYTGGRLSAQRPLRAVADPERPEGDHSWATCREEPHTPTVDAV